MGFDNWRKAIDGLTIDVPLLIENTAGGANAMARSLERIAQLWDAISSSANADRVGFCLDTCHAHAGGNQLSGLVDKIKGITGRIDLVHGNDSRDAFDSGADRHANLGGGFCDPRAWPKCSPPPGRRSSWRPPATPTPAGRPGVVGQRGQLTQVSTRGYAAAQPTLVASLARLRSPAPSGP